MSNFEWQSRRIDLLAHRQWLGLSRRQREETHLVPWPLERVLNTIYAQTQKGTDERTVRETPWILGLVINLIVRINVREDRFLERDDKAYNNCAKHKGETRWAEEKNPSDREKVLMTERSGSWSTFLNLFLLMESSRRLLCTHVYVFLPWPGCSTRREGGTNFSNEYFVNGYEKKKNTRSIRRVREIESTRARAPPFPSFPLFRQFQEPIGIDEWYRSLILADV